MQWSCPFIAACKRQLIIHQRCSRINEFISKSMETQLAQHSDLMQRCYAFVVSPLHISAQSCQNVKTLVETTLRRDIRRRRAIPSSLISKKNNLFSVTNMLLSRQNIKSERLNANSYLINIRIQIRELLDTQWVPELHRLQIDLYKSTGFFKLE